eukprot:1073493-Amphidinium_carterae.2
MFLIEWKAILRRFSLLLIVPSFAKCSCGGFEAKVACGPFVLVLFDAKQAVRIVLNKLHA